MTVSSIPVWLDCDPGLDDAVAILLGAYSPLFNLLAISTCHGNSSIEHVTHNALALLTLLQKTEIPVYVGAAHGINIPPVHAPQIHGADGFGGVQLPEPSFKTVNEQGDMDTLIDDMFAAVKKYPGEISLVVTGPMTNVTLMFKKYPDAKELVKYVVFMGGNLYIPATGFENGASFNVMGDPLGLNLDSHDPLLEGKIIEVTGDVTSTVLCTKEIQAKILNAPHTTKIRQAIHDLMLFFATTYAKEQGYIYGPPVHDPVCLHVLLERYGIKDVGIKSERYRLTAVEEGYYKGKLEFEKVLEGTQGSEVTIGIDVPQFWHDLLAALEATDALEQ